jgi:hypothetical protein
VVRGWKFFEILLYFCLLLSNFVWVLLVVVVVDKEGATDYLSYSQDNEVFSI